MKAKEEGKEKGGGGRGMGGNKQGKATKTLINKENLRPGKQKQPKKLEK